MERPVRLEWKCALERAPSAEPELEHEDGPEPLGVIGPPLTMLPEHAGNGVRPEQTLLLQRLRTARLGEVLRDAALLPQPVLERNGEAELVLAVVDHVRQHAFHPLPEEPLGALDPLQLEPA